MKAWRPEGRVPREVQRAPSSGAVFKRSAEWTREMPGIVRGLYALAAPFRWHLLVIFGFNAVIAAWETAPADHPRLGRRHVRGARPLSRDGGDHRLAGAGDRRAARHRAALPARPLRALVRQAEIREARRPALPEARPVARSAATHAEVRDGKAPIVQEGRERRLRADRHADPRPGLRGARARGARRSSVFMSPIAGRPALLGIVADLWVTLLMDARLFRPYAHAAGARVPRARAGVQASRRQPRGRPRRRAEAGGIQRLRAGMGPLHRRHPLSPRCGA